VPILAKDEAGGGHAKPFLRWAGSKRALLPLLKRHVPRRFGKYIEPFAGSACLFFEMAPNRAVLADLNDRLIDTYRAVAQNPGRVSGHLSRLPVGSDAYYEIRKGYPHLRGPVARAATFIYLNRFCFNGLYRTSRSGRFNVPYGAPRSTAVPSKSELALASKAIASAILMSGDFEDVVLSTAKRGDFVYLDPPFHSTSTRVFTQYNASPFGRSDLDRLVDLLEVIDRRGCRFLLSYAASKESVKAFDSYSLRKIVTRRNISGFPQHRGAVKELLVRNFED